jgi:hypothetical protein
MRRELDACPFPVHNITECRCDVACECHPDLSDEDYDEGER